MKTLNYFPLLAMLFLVFCCGTTLGDKEQTCTMPTIHIVNCSKLALPHIKKNLKN
ncbi:hypothetical protein ACOSP7_028457 [Xanthoceras sorbifolium]